MGLIKNFKSLTTSQSRKKVLELIQFGLLSIQPEEVFKKNIKVENQKLQVLNSSYNLSNYKNIYLIGFGKGSAKNSKLLEDALGEKLTDGYVIDTGKEDFKKIQFTQGSHPIITQENIDFTQKVIERFSNLTEEDLVLVVICGGGSAMFEYLHSISLAQKIEIEKELLKSGATIIEMNKIRQHLSDVKGGGLAQILYPAKVVAMIYSDVPGNDIAYIASGPTVKNDTSIEDALSIIKKYNIFDIPFEAFVENPKGDKYFEKVDNYIVLSNLTALNAMVEKAKTLGINTRIYSDKFQGEASEGGKKLVEETKSGEVLLVGGETTVKVKGNGIGGRNQEVVLGVLPFLEDNTTIAAIATDGWDNTEAAGAIADKDTLEKAKKMNLNIEEYLSNNNSFEFFQKTSDAIITGRLPSNISDLIIVYKS